MQVRPRVAAVAAPKVLSNSDRRHVLAEALDKARQVEHLAMLAAPTNRDERHLRPRHFAQCSNSVPHLYQH